MRWSRSQYDGSDAICRRHISDQCHRIDAFTVVESDIPDEEPISAQFVGPCGSTNMKLRVFCSTSPSRHMRRSSTRRVESGSARETVALIIALRARDGILIGNPCDDLVIWGYPQSDRGARIKGAPLDFWKTRA